MDQPKKVLPPKRLIGEIGRKESTVGEQLLKTLPGQFCENPEIVLNLDEGA